MLTFANATGLDPLSLFKPQKLLVLGSRLGLSAEAVGLQFLDDLFKPRICRRGGDRTYCLEARCLGPHHGSACHCP